MAEASNCTTTTSVGPTVPDRRDYYSVTEAADLLGVSRVSIWRWISAGHLPAARLGRRTTRIRRQDLERLLGERETDGPRAPEDPRAGTEAADGAVAAPRADWRTVGPSEHFVQFYEADAFLLDALKDFIGATLRAGDAGIVIATQMHRDDLEDRLRAEGLDVDGARADGRYVSMDAAELLARIMVDGAPDPMRFAEVVGGVIARAAEGRRHVRAFGEMVALLAEEGKHAVAVRLEELWNDLQTAQTFTLFCAYPLACLDGEAGAAALGDVCAAHASVIPAESYAALPTPDDRLRAITALQQEAASLEGEVAQRKAAEAVLRGQKQVLEMIATGAALADVLVALIRLIEAQSDGLLCSVLVRDPEREQFHLGIAPSLPDSYTGVLAHASIAPPYFGPCSRAAHLGEEVITADVATDERWAEQWRDLALSHGLRACYSAPICASDGRILGSFGMYYREPRDPKLASVQLAATATHLAGIAVERHRAEEALREETETLETINRIGRLLTAELDLETLVQAVTDAATALSEARFGAFFYNVTDERGDAYQLYTISGARREDFERFPLPRNTAIFGATFRGEGVVRLADVTQDPRYGLNAPYHGLPPGHLPVRSYLAVPVVARSGAVIGGLFLGHPEVGIFTERAEQLVGGLAAQAAIAMDNARLYQEAQHSIHARDEFLSSAAHDLKTPLTSIKGQAQLLHRRATRAQAPEAQRLAEGLLEGLTSIDQTASRLAALIETLLDLTRVQLDRPLELDHQPTDLVALVQQAVAALQPSTTRHHLRAEADQTELVGLWDQPRLARVVDNLLSNAIKYSPDGGPVTTSIRLEQGGTEAWAVLEVRDAGLGIPAAELPRVFERFQRASNVAGRIEGTGIGLASARYIVESHGGTLTVASQEGQGSTFTVYLPLTVDGAAVQAVNGAKPRQR